MTGWQGYLFPANTHRNAVRGLLDRAVSSDRGYFASTEIQTPDLANYLGLSSGSLRAAAFYDWADGQNINAATGYVSHTHISSMGVGLRYSLDKNLLAKLDIAKVMNTSSVLENGAEAGKPALHGHFSLSIGF
jgi:hemolysin activation/secretion protein